MKKQEIRMLAAGELRAAGDGKISGYAAVFNSPSSDLGGFTEIVRPGAFRRAIREKQDCRCLFNHDRNMVLGRVSNGTLSLAEDSRGLHFECSLPDTTYANDLRACIKRGDISACSFGFVVGEDAWPSRNRRELVEIAELIDVSPVTAPAYPQTSLQARSAEVFGPDVRVGIYRALPDELPADELEVLRARLRLAQAL